MAVSVNISATFNSIFDQARYPLIEVSENPTPTSEALNSDPTTVRVRYINERHFL
jgi:hypothetical protein